MRKFAKYLFLITFLLSLSPLVLADTYISAGQKIEILIPSEGVQADKYAISFANNPEKVITFGKFERKDNKTYRVLIESEKLEPGLYRISYSRNSNNQTEEIFIAPPTSYASPKLTSVLRQALYFADRGDRQSLSFFRQKRDLKLAGDNLLVNVELKIKNGSREKITPIVESLNGKIKNYTSSRLNIEIPLGALKTLYENNDVLFVRDMGQLDLDAVSQGLAGTNADLWHLAGFKGKGIKIAVVDSDFKGYKNSIAKGELSANLIPVVFGPASIDEDSDNHGTNCAEIVYDLAPEAQLYLISIDAAESSFENLVDYLIKEKIDIVSRSASLYQGPFNGASKWAQLIDKAKGEGVFWVNSSGNRATTHWEGAFKNNGSNFHVWSGNKIRMAINNAAGKSLKFRLAWNDWGKDADGYPGGNAHGQDYKIKLYCDNVLVDFADDVQTNNADIDPYENFNFSDAASGVYEVEIEAKNSTGFGEYFELFMHTGNASFEFAKPESSVTIAGDAAGAFTVGAVDAATHKLEDYSSRGPTNGVNSGPSDNTSLIKPDVSGPTNVTTSLYDSFGGTSASTPHIAGLAALVKQAKGFTLPEQIKNYLESYTNKLGYAAKNNEVGAGLVVLDDQSVIGGIQMPTKEADLGAADIVLYVFPSALPQGMQTDIYFYGKGLIKVPFIDFGPGIITMGTVYPFENTKEIVSAPELKVDQNAIVGTREVKLAIKKIGQPDQTDQISFEVLSAMTPFVSIVPNTNQVKWPGWSGKLKLNTSAIGLDYKVVKPIDVNFGEGIKVKAIENGPYFSQFLVELEILPDAAIGPRTVVVTNPNGDKIVGKDVFMIAPLPKIYSVLPSVGKPGQEVEMNVSFDTNFGLTSPTVDLQFASGDISLLEVLDKDFSDNKIIVKIKIAENAAPGWKTFTLWGMTGSFEVLPKGLTIKSINPHQLKQGSPGMIMHIYGAGFLAGFTCDFGAGINVIPYLDVWSTGYHFVDSEYVQAYVAVAETASTGLRNVTIKNQDGESFTAVGSLEVLAKEESGPLIEKVVPNQVEQGKDDGIIHVFGQNFQEGAKTDFGADIAIPTAVFVNGSQLTAAIKVNPAAVIGKRDVKVTNPDGLSFTAVNSLEVIAKKTFGPVPLEKGKVVKIKKEAIKVKTKRP